MQRIRFNQGEQRHVKLLIHATDPPNAPFVVSGAKWELLCGGQAEADGDCIIMDHVIDTYISPQKRTIYRLKIEYKIADETFVEQIEVAVE